MNIRQLFKGLFVLGIVLLVLFGLVVFADEPSDSNEIMIMPLVQAVEETPAVGFFTFSIDQPEYIVSRHRENLEPREYRMPRIPKYDDVRTDEYRHYMFHYYWEDYEHRYDGDKRFADDHYDTEKYDCYVLNNRGHRTYINCDDCVTCIS